MRIIVGRRQNFKATNGELEHLFVNLESLRLELSPSIEFPLWVELCENSPGL